MAGCNPNDVHEKLVPGDDKVHYIRLLPGLLVPSDFHRLLAVVGFEESGGEGSGMKGSMRLPSMLYL